MLPYEDTHLRDLYVPIIHIMTTHMVSRHLDKY